VITVLMPNDQTVDYDWTRYRVKVGDEAEKQVYLVGKTADGKWAGLKTTVVETQAGAVGDRSPGLGGFSPETASVCRTEVCRSLPPLRLAEVAERPRR
jgi:hypothetical protein